MGLIKVNDKRNTQSDVEDYLVKKRNDVVLIQEEGIKMGEDS